MRGDSRRDLYAKTLALCGLGVLAGAGALVDYWPVGLRLPSAAIVRRVVEAEAGPLRVPEAALSTNAVLAVSSKSPIRPSRVSPSRDVARDFESALVIGNHTFSDEYPYRVEPPETSTLELPVFVTTDLSLVGPMRFRLAEPAWTLDAPHASSDAFVDEADGFFADAFKKTGTSIVRTSLKTGSSVADAFRAVGGAFRRAF